MVKSGPPNNATLTQWALGMLLWWRLYATMGLLTAPFVAGMLVLVLHTSGVAVWVTWIVGFSSYHQMLKVSPKYDLSRNY